MERQTQSARHRMFQIRVISTQSWRRKSRLWTTWQTKCHIQGNRHLARYSGFRMDQSGSHRRKTHDTKTVRLRSFWRGICGFRAAHRLVVVVRGMGSIHHHCHLGHRHICGHDWHGKSSSCEAERDNHKDKEPDAHEIHVRSTGLKCK